MDAPTIELAGRRYAPVRDSVDAWSAYGLWDTLIAVGADGERLGSCSAHDGDFYPETPADYVEALRSLRRGTRVAPFPLRVDIDITQTCNANCIFCFSRPYQFPDYRGARIGRDDFAQIIDICAARGAKTIRLCGGGDPLAHPEISDLLPLAHERGLQLVVITSGDLIDDAIARGLALHVDHIHWSVNAAHDSTRSLLHRTASSTRTLSRTREFIGSIIARARGRDNRNPLMVWGTYLLLPENVDEIVESAIQMREIRVNSISFRPVHHGLHSDWSDQLIERREEALAAALLLADPPTFCVFAPRDPLEALRSPPATHFVHCRSREVRTVIEATRMGGALQSCGMHRGDLNSGVRMERGDVRFGDAWSELLRRHDLDGAPRSCSECIDVSMNKTLEFLDDVLTRSPGASFIRARALD